MIGQQCRSDQQNAFCRVFLSSSSPQGERKTLQLLEKDPRRSAPKERRGVNSPALEAEDMADIEADDAAAEAEVAPAPETEEAPPVKQSAREGSAIIRSRPVASRGVFVQLTGGGDGGGDSGGVDGDTSSSASLASSLLSGSDGRSVGLEKKGGVSCED